jgi:hypothetical protein
LSEHATILPPVKTIPASLKADAIPVSKQSRDLYTDSLQYFPIQRKLSVGAVDDPLEEEADNMADKVMRMPEQNFIQRKCAACEEEERAQRKPIESFIQKKCAHCEEEERAQRKPLASFIQKKQSLFNNTVVASDSVSNQIQSTKGSGNVMPDATKSFMENRFGADFSNVKIHTGNYASQLSNQLNAQAFTVGKDIYFNDGKYQPQFSEGKRLLAHELTHVIQQGNALLQNKIIQRDLAVAPTVATPSVHTLTSAQKAQAIKYNQVILNDEPEISEIRDLIGRSKLPAIIDDDFIEGLVSFQASFGLVQDGKLGAATAGRLADQITAAAN